MGKNPRVFLDFSIGGRGGGGRVVIELFADVTPRTAENFRGLCTGEYGQGRTTKKSLNYAGCSVFRSIKGFMLQTGDIQFNTGDGGESIYGGKFNDEDFTRRHTQAGILSMANTGRNSNGSQFFITLKRSAQLDGKHVAFGQVVGGMDVIRAIGQVPTDRDDKPRVPITIVSCGEEGKMSKNMADPHAQLEKKILDLNEEIAPSGIKVPESVKAKAILAGKQGGVPVDASFESTKRVVDATSDEVEGSAGLAPARNERERKLFELRLRMNQCRAQNNKEVVEEQKRAADPEYSKKQAEERHKRALEKEESADQADGQSTKEKRGRPGELPEGKAYLNDTIEAVEMRQAKKKKGNPDAFGWDVFNQDSLYRAHDKRLKEIQFDEKAYHEQKEELSEGTALFPGFGHQASEAGKERLQQAMDKIASKKAEYSRRRMVCSEEDVTYINDRNRQFNKKMQRAFGAYTEEIRQNLERGTAL